MRQGGGSAVAVAVLKGGSCITLAHHGTGEPVPRALECHFHKSNDDSQISVNSSGLRSDALWSEMGRLRSSWVCSPSSSSRGAAHREQPRTDTDITNAMMRFRVMPLVILTQPPTLLGTIAISHLLPFPCPSPVSCLPVLLSSRALLMLCSPSPLPLHCWQVYSINTIQYYVLNYSNIIVYYTMLYFVISHHLT